MGKNRSSGYRDQDIPVDDNPLLSHPLTDRRAFPPTALRFASFPIQSMSRTSSFAASSRLGPMVICTSSSGHARAIRPAVGEIFTFCLIDDDGFHGHKPNSFTLHANHSNPWPSVNWVVEVRKRRRWLFRSLSRPHLSTHTPRLRSSSSRNRCVPRTSWRSQRNARKIALKATHIARQ